MNDRAPGVSSNDLSSSGVRPPSGSSTSIAALVGHLQAGEPRRITTWKEFDKDTPMADEEKRAAESGGARSPYLADAVSGWFANGGGTCWIVGAGQDGSIAGYEAALASLDPEVNIVITPDLWEGGDDGAMIARVIARHCAAAPTRMALLHTAKDADAAALPKRLGLNEEEAQYTTVYHPWLSVSGTSRGDPADTADWARRGYLGTDRRRARRSPGADPRGTPRAYAAAAQTHRCRAGRTEPHGRELPAGLPGPGNADLGRPHPLPGQ